MSNRPSSLNRLERPTVRDHLAASGFATGLFLVLFFKALFGGCHYGALPHQQIVGLLWQNPWLGKTELAPTERQPNLLDPDYHFLYELDAQAAARDLRSGHLPFFDFSRMLGVPLWGSLIFDFGNPLNLLLRFLEPPGVHLIKVLCCMILAANGFVILMRELGAKTAVAWIVSFTLYLGGNYAIYFVHWIGAYGTICAAPMVLGLSLRFLRTGTPGAFVGLSLCAAFLATAQCTHIGMHLVIFCFAACMISWLAAGPERKALLPRLGLLVLAGICAALATSEIIWQTLLTARDSARLPAALVHHHYPHLYLPQVHQAYSTLFFGNIETSGVIFEVLFLPAAALLSVWAVSRGMSGFRREVRVVGWLAVLFTVYFFVGWIDAPLILLCGKLYAPNPSAWRGLLSFYLPLFALAGLGSERILVQSVAKPIRVGAGVGLAISAVFAGVALLVKHKWVRDNLFFGSGAMYDSYLKSAGFWLVLLGNAGWMGAILSGKAARLRAGLVVAGAIAICVGMGSSRMPFYRRGERIVFTNADGVADINTPRTSRTMPGADFLVSSVMNMLYRYVHDAALSASGLKALTGYHTSMSVQELKVFDNLVSEQYLKARARGTLRNYSLGFYHVFLDAEAVVQGNRLREEKLLLLKLLGVEAVIDGVALSRTNSESIADCSRWPRMNLQVSTAAHLVEGAREKDVLAIFSGALNTSSATNLLARLRPTRLEPTADGRGYRANLAGNPGTLVVPYHFGRWFQVALDGQPVAEKERLGVCVVEVTPQSKILEIRARRDGILRRTLGGLLAGCLLTLVGCYACRKLTKPAPPPDDGTVCTKPSTPPPIGGEALRPRTAAERVSGAAGVENVS